MWKKGTGRRTGGWGRGEAECRTGKGKRERGKPNRDDALPLPASPFSFKSESDGARVPVKYFTLDQANRTLPLVGRVVTDIVDEYRRWKDLIFRYELIAAGSKAGAGGSEGQ